MYANFYSFKSSVQIALLLQNQIYSQKHTRPYRKVLPEHILFSGGHL